MAGLAVERQGENRRRSSWIKLGASHQQPDSKSWFALGGARYWVAALHSCGGL